MSENFFIYGENIPCILVSDMNLEKSDEELEKYNIRSFLNENEIQERNNLLDEIKSLDYHIKK